MRFAPPYTFGRGKDPKGVAAPSDDLVVIMAIPIRSAQWRWNAKRPRGLTGGRMCR